MFTPAVEQVLSIVGKHLRTMLTRVFGGRRCDTLHSRVISRQSVRTLKMTLQAVSVPENLVTLLACVCTSFGPMGRLVFAAHVCTSERGTTLSAEVQLQLKRQLGARLELRSVMFQQMCPRPLR